MIKRRSFLGLLAAIPFVGEAFAVGEPGHVLPTKPADVPMPPVSPPGSAVWAGFGREHIENGLGQEGDLYIDHSTPGYTVFQKAADGRWYAVAGMVSTKPVPLPKEYFSNPPVIKRGGNHV